VNNRQYPVHLSIASSTEIEQTARQLKAAREEFLITGIPAQRSTRPMILESWQRCSAMQVSPLLRNAPLAITHEDQLRCLLEGSQLLLRAAHQVMKHLSDFLDGYVIVLSDANGCLLKVIGDTRTRRRLARIDFVPGGDWSEAAAGTNALGTAITDGHVVQLLGAEHYCEGWQDLTCTAAPIRHPLSGEILGTLDVTGNYHLIRPFLSSFIAAAALQVQQEIHELLPSADKGRTKTQSTSSRSSTRRMPASRSAIDRQRYQVDTSAVSMGNAAQAFMLMQEQRVRNAEFLTAVVSAISASLDLDDTLEKVAEQTAHLLRLDSVAVCLFGESEEIASLHTWTKQRVRRTKYQHDLEVLLRECKVVSLIQERGEPIIIDDTSTSVILSAGLASGIRSLLLLPLITARGVIGFILASRSTCYHWLVDDVLPVLTLATYAATAIENARHFTILQQHIRRVEVLNALSQLLSTLPDPAQHLEVVLKRIVEIMGLDVGMTLLCDQQRERLTLAAHYGLPETASLDLCAFALRSLYGVAHLILTTGKSVMTCAIERDEHSTCGPLTIPGSCDAMVVPLASGNTILGVLLLASLAHRKLTSEDLALFTAIGQQLGQTLTNIQLRQSANETEALREADQIKSRFVSAISHDLQSPLTAIQTSVESLLHHREAHSSHTQEHLLHNIAAQAGMLDSLVDRLLDLSRIEAGALSLDYDWIDLPIFIAETIAKFEELHSGCRVEQDLAENLPMLYVDPERIAQVLWNLLENASKYAPSNTSIQLEIRWTGNEVLVGIADRGPGIPAEDREKIFQHFYRLKRDQKKRIQGSGLGLAICQGIIQIHGGRIWVEERAGGGSVFRFSLPRHKTEPLDLEQLEKMELFAVSPEGK